MKNLQSKLQNLSKELTEQITEAENYYYSFKFNEAIKITNELIKCETIIPEVLALHSIICANIPSKLHEGLELIRKTVASNINNPLCWQAFGIFNMTVRNYDEAIKSFKIAMKLSAPHVYEIYRELSKCYIANKDFNSFLKMKIEIYPFICDSMYDYMQLVIGYYIVEDFSKIEELIDKYYSSEKKIGKLALNQTGEAELKYCYIYALLKLKKSEKAYIHLKAVIEEPAFFNTIQLLELYGTTCLLNNSLDDAMKTFMILINQIPNNYRYYFCYMLSTKNYQKLLPMRGNTMIPFALYPKCINIDNNFSYSFNNPPISYYTNLNLTCIDIYNGNLKLNNNLFSFWSILYLITNNKQKITNENTDYNNTLNSSKTIDLGGSNTNNSNYKIEKKLIREFDNFGEIYKQYNDAITAFPLAFLTNNDLIELQFSKLLKLKSIKPKYSMVQQLYELLQFDTQKILLNLLFNCSETNVYDSNSYDKFRTYVFVILSLYYSYLCKHNSDNIMKSLNYIERALNILENDIDIKTWEIMIKYEHSIISGKEAGELLNSLYMNSYKDKYLMMNAFTIYAENGDFISLNNIAKHFNKLKEDKKLLEGIKEAESDNQDIFTELKLARAYEHKKQFNNALDRYELIIERAKTITHDTMDFLNFCTMNCYVYSYYKYIKTVNRLPNTKFFSEGYSRYILVLCGFLFNSIEIDFTQNDTILSDDFDIHMIKNIWPLNKDKRINLENKDKIREILVKTIKDLLILELEYLSAELFFSLYISTYKLDMKEENNKIISSLKKYFNNNLDNYVAKPLYYHWLHNNKNTDNCLEMNYFGNIEIIQQNTDIRYAIANILCLYFTKNKAYEILHNEIINNTESFNFINTKRKIEYELKDLDSTLILLKFMYEQNTKIIKNK